MRRAAALGVAVLVVATACADGSHTTTSAPSSPPTTTTTSNAPGVTDTLAPPPAGTAPTPTSPPPVEIARRELREVIHDDPPFELVIAIPYLQGVADPEIQDRVNQYLLDHVTRREEDFAREVTDYLDQVGPVDGPVSFLELFYDVGVLTPQLLSLRFGETTFFQGAANPSRSVKTITVDLQSGDLLTVAELFTGTEWGFALDFLLRQAVADTYYPGDPTELDAWLDPDDLLIPEDVVLTPLAFEFWFQELWVGPAVLGTPSVRLPYSAIGVYINPGGIVGQLAEDAQVGCASIAGFDAATGLVFTSEIGSADQAAALEDATARASELRAHRPDLTSAIDVLAGWAEAFVDNPSTELTEAEMDAIETSNDIMRSELDLCG